MKRALVSGALANKPGNGGNTWSRLGWILGLQELGYEVFFIEQLSPHVEAARARDYFNEVMVNFGLSTRAFLIGHEGNMISGPGLDEVRHRIEGAELLVNISGHLTLPAIKELPSCRIYYDDDPGYTQFWQALGDPSPRLEGHDAYCTLGANIGRAECPIPTLGIEWRPILPPVVLLHWPFQPRMALGKFTTVASWRGAYPPVRFNGRTYGIKAHEFRKYLDLPARTGLSFEIALDIHPGDERDIQSLRSNGWALVDPVTCTGAPDRYRAYLRDSGAEFSVVQGIYAETGSGWFSDRSARYLASGRPVLVQDTGISSRLPVGRGLLTFRDLEEAVEGARNIADHYEAHSLAARTFAVEHLDARKVIGGLLDTLNLSSEVRS